MRNLDEDRLRGALVAQLSPSTIPANARNIREGLPLRSAAPIAPRATPPPPAPTPAPAPPPTTVRLSEARARLPAAQLAAEAGSDPAGDGPVQRPCAWPRTCASSRQHPGRGIRQPPDVALLAELPPVTAVRYRAPLEAGFVSPDSFSCHGRPGRRRAGAGRGAGRSAGHADRPRPPRAGHRLLAAQGAGPA